MPESRPWLRLCGRCAHTVGSACLTSVCWIVWALLSVSLVGLFVIYLHREITVPDFLLRRIERKLEFAQLSARFGRTACDPEGNLVLEDVRLFGAGIVEPLASADALRLHMDFWAIATGGFDVHEIEVVNLRLDCPAIVSPSGASEPILDALYGTLIRDGNDWDLAQGVCSAGRVLVTGRLHWTARPGSGAARELPPDLVKSYCELSRRAAEALRRTEQLDSPRLKFSVTAAPDQPLRAHVELTAARAELPAGTTVEGLRFAAEAVGRRNAPVTLAVTAEAVRAATTGDLRIEHPWLRTRGRLELEPLRWSGDPLQFSAAGVTRGPDRADFPQGSVALNAWPAVQGELAAMVRGSPIALAASGDWTTRSGEATVAGTLTPELLNDAAKRAAVWRGSKILARMEFSGPVGVHGKVRLAPGGKLAEARINGRIGTATVWGVTLEDTSAEMWTDGHRLRVEPVVLERPGTHVEGSYEMEFPSLDYRFLLHGRFFPDSITPWIGKGWGRFWADFAFGPTPPLADADIRGRWKAPRFNSYYGWADVPAVTLRGVPLDRLQATFFIRPDHYDILAFEGRRGALAATGRFTRDDDPRRDGGAKSLPRSIDFQVHSTLPLPDGARLFGEEGRRTVEPFVFAEPPTVDATGRLRWDDQGLHDDVAVQVTAPGVFHFHQFPVEDPRIAFTMKEGTIDVPQIDAKLAGGRLTGKSTVTGPRTARQLTVEGQLLGANLEETTSIWRNYRLKTAPPDAAPLPPPHNLGKDSLMDLRLHAAGPLDNLLALHGEGSLDVSHAELGGVELFGPLAVRFNTGRASFAIEEDKLRFTKLRLSGAVAVLEGKGRYTMPNSGLDFNVKLLPFHEASFPVFSLLGAVLEPFAFALEVRVTGTLAKPDWYFVAGPTNLLGLKNPLPPPAGPVAPAAGSPAAPPPAESGVSPDSEDDGPPDPAAPPRPPVSG